MVTDLSLKQWAAETRTRDVRMVAAHMKYASPELCLRNSEASQGKLPSSGCVAPALSSSVHTMRPRLARCCGLGSGSTTTLQHVSVVRGIMGIGGQVSIPRHLYYNL